MSQISELPLFHVVGFSGHRLVERPGVIDKAIREMFAALRREAPGEWMALSSVALGSDWLFTRTAIALGVPWSAVLPLPPAEFRKDFSADDWKTVESLLPEAEQVRVIAEYGSREDAYLDCGMETVNGCDVLVAVWNGEPARGKGGTAQVIGYAREMKKPLIVIDAATGATRRENFDHFHPHDHHLDYFNGLPERSAPSDAAANGSRELATISAFQRKVDDAASRGAPQLRRLVAGTVLLHVLATLVAAAALSFELHWMLMPWLKLLCLLGALTVALVLRQAGSHHNWVRCRLAAEIARSALATWRLPRAVTLFRDLDLAEFAHLTRSLHVLHRRAVAAEPVPLETFKRLYISERLDDQLAYYRRRLATALPQLARLRLGFWSVTILAIACTAFYSVAHTMHSEILPVRAEELVYYFLPISLPVVAAALISLISVHDLHRRVARYREMEHLLGTNRSQLGFCETWNSVERVVQKTERALLQEVLEWHSITSFSESH